MRIHTIQTGLSAAYLLESDEGLVLVDAGAPGAEKKILARMDRLGRDDLRLIFITHAHYDHYGSAAALRRLTGAPVAIHGDDAEAMACGETRLGSVRLWGHLTRYCLLPLAERLRPAEPVEADQIVADGDDLARFGLQATVLHTPGHTLGSSTLLAAGSAFAGDLISTTGRPHPQRLYAQDWHQLAKSLRRLQELLPDYVYAGHGHRPLHGEMLKRLGPFLPR